MNTGGVKKAVVLLSGGMDSSTLLWHAHHLGIEPVAVSVHYGQRHKRELVAALRVVDAFREFSGQNIPYHIVDLAALKPLLAGSSQTSEEVAVPHGHYAAETMKLTVVPNRNMILISVAVAAAISHKANAVYYAAHAGDHAIYPDCRPEFVDAMKAAVALCDWSYPLLHAPFVEMSKGEIALYGSKLGVPYGLTYSCYEGREKHCGKCGTCVERREAFQFVNSSIRGGFIDPTEYEE